MNVKEKTDSEIQQDVIRELKGDTRVRETEVGVEVSNGIVTLTGTVSSWGKRHAAERAAHRVQGVLDVANDIQVHLHGDWRKTDTEIAQAVRQALEWDDFVPDKKIRSTVSNGVVTLEGTVDYATQRYDAERALRNLSGVQRIVNEIEVVPAPASPAEVKQVIQEALKRQATREADRIQVSVKDGKVTLSGRVHSWAEHKAARGAALGVPGVRYVEADLRIEPYASA
jgi:osmotically-inducible protein OsmY